MKNNMLLQKPIFNVNKLTIGQLILFKSNGGDYRPATLVGIKEEYIEVSYYEYRAVEPKTVKISAQDYSESNENSFIFLSDTEVNYYTKAILNKDISDSVYIVTGYDDQDTDILGVYAKKDMAEKRKENEQAKIEEDNDPDWYTSIHCKEHKIIK